MLFSFKNIVQKICQIARCAVCSAAVVVVAAMEKKRRDSAFTKEQEIFIIKQFHCGLGPIEVRILSLIYILNQGNHLKFEINFILLFSFL